jgi:hypothetical protein
MVLRHQVRVLERQLHGRVRYRPVDRAVLAAQSRLLPRARWRTFLVTPETLLRWHRELARRRWRRWRPQRGPGRPPMGDEVVELIVRLGRENRRWGCVRIQGELGRLAIRVSASSVRGSYADMVSDRCPGRDRRGPSSCVPRLTRCSPPPFGGELAISRLGADGDLLFSLTLLGGGVDATTAALSAPRWCSGRELRPAQLLGSERRSAEGILLVLREQVPEENHELSRDGDCCRLAPRRARIRSEKACSGPGARATIQADSTRARRAPAQPCLEMLPCLAGERPD